MSINTCNLPDRTIYRADNLDVLRQINSNCIDLIYLDPPFNKNQMFYAIFTESDKKKKAGFKDVWGKEDIKDEWVELIQDQWGKLYKYLDGIDGIGIKGAKYYLIYMAIRLIEMYRILKDTGSLYLHCDPTMSHYIKILLDCIFDEKNFRNEIVWCYSSTSQAKNWFPKKHDIIYFYSKEDKYNFYSDKIRIPFKKPLVKHGKTWKSAEKNVLNKLTGEGKIPEDFWIDIYPVNSMAKERVGYPTQKPLALLERIIKASSNERDIVLDPFCGCATTCVASEKLGRKWIGIDKSKITVELINKRLKKEIPVTLFKGKSNYETKMPTRTDYPHRIEKGIKEKLYGNQQGYCNGCGKHFEIRIFDIDHIIPKSFGGTNEVYNLQLLCGSCNAYKSNRTMTHLRGILIDKGIIK